MGGGGEAFREAGYAFPKPLIKIVGRPMLLHLLDNLQLRCCRLQPWHARARRLTRRRGAPSAGQARRRGMAGRAGGALRAVRGDAQPLAGVPGGRHPGGHVRHEDARRGGDALHRAAAHERDGAEPARRVPRLRHALLLRRPRPVSQPAKGAGGQTPCAAPRAPASASSPITIGASSASVTKTTPTPALASLRPPPPPPPPPRHLHLHLARAASLHQGACFYFVDHGTRAMYSYLRVGAGEVVKEVREKNAISRMRASRQRPAALREDREQPRWLSRLRPLPLTPERRLSSARAGGGLGSSPRAGRKLPLSRSPPSRHGQRGCVRLPDGASAGLKCRPPCLTTPPHLPAWCLLGPRPILCTPERRLSTSEACGGLISSPQAAPK